MNKGESVNVEDFRREIKRHFYRDEKTFFQQRRMLIKALMLPARWLDKSNAFLAEEDYENSWTTSSLASGNTATWPPSGTLASTSWTASSAT